MRQNGWSSMDHISRPIGAIGCRLPRGVLLVRLRDGKQRDSRGSKAPEGLTSPPDGSTFRARVTFCLVFAVIPVRRAARLPLDDMDVATTTPSLAVRRGIATTI